MEHTILFRTPAGSRLYGLHHADSDYDWYTVVDKVKTGKAKYDTQTITGDQDERVVDFGTWIDLCQRGVPNALEAMFSTQATIDKIEPYRLGFRAGTEYKAYCGVMKRMSIEHPDSLKHKRHVLRLGMNMSDLRDHGRFNPTMTPTMVRWITKLAEERDAQRCYELGLDFAWS